MAKPQLARNVNSVTGSGFVMLGFEDANGNVHNFEYRAQSKLSVSIVSETQDFPDEDSAVEQDLLTIAKGTKRTAKLEIKDWSPDMAAAYLLGDASTFTQSSTPVVDESVTFKLGAYVYFGRSTTNPAGNKNISAETLTDATGTTTYSAGTDYIMTAEDAAKGRAFIPLTSTIADGSTGLADYTPAAESRSRIASSGNPAKVAWIIFESDYSSGEAEEIVIPKGTLIPQGDLTMKDREAIRTMTFDIKIGTRDGYEQVYIDGVAA